MLLLLLLFVVQSRKCHGGYISSRIVSSPRRSRGRFAGEPIDRGAAPTRANVAPVRASTAGRPLQSGCSDRRDIRVAKCIVGCRQRPRARTSVRPSVRHQQATTMTCGCRGVSVAAQTDRQTDFDVYIDEIAHTAELACRPPGPAACRRPTGSTVSCNVGYVYVLNHCRSG